VEGIRGKPGGGFKKYYDLFFRPEERCTARYSG